MLVSHLVKVSKCCCKKQTTISSQQDFYAASHFYELSYQKDSDDVQQWWQMAEAYRFTFQYDLAAQFYHKVYLEDGLLNYPDVQLWEGYA